MLASSSVFSATEIQRSTATSGRPGGNENASNYRDLDWRRHNTKKSKFGKTISVRWDMTSVAKLA